MTTTMLDAHELNTMSQEDFGELINGLTRNELAPDVRRLLLSSAVIDRTCSELELILGSVEGQIEARIADQEAAKARFMQSQDDLNYELKQLRIESDGDLLPDRQAEIYNRLRGIGEELEELRRGWREEKQRFETWRARSIRFKTGIHSDLVEARRLREYMEKTHSGSTNRVRDLEAAIRHHREHKCDAGCEEQCWGDLELWEMVS